MAHAVSAHIEFIETDDVFWKIILHMLIHTELSLHRLFGGKKVCDLDVAFFSVALADKINLSLTNFADGDTVAAP